MTKINLGKIVPKKNVDYFDGKDGYTPVKGVDYFDGKDGIGIKDIFVKDDHLFIKLTNDEVIDLGVIIGKEGKTGPRGQKGVSVVSVEIRDNHLFVKLSSGVEIDAGYIGGGSGSTNYNDLTNKPTINNVELQGNKTLEELGLDLSSYATKSELEEKEDVFRYETMPEASASYTDKIVEYIGTSNSDYTNGYFYKGVHNSVQESITATQTDNVIPLGDITVNANTFKSKVDGAGTYEFVVKGYPTKLTYMNISTFPPTTINVTRDGMFDRQPMMPNATPMYSWVDGANNFYITNTLLPNASTKLYSLDIQTNEMTDTGASYVNASEPSTMNGYWTLKSGNVYTPVELSDYGIYLVSTGMTGNAISVNYVEANETYSWVQKNVQPSSGGGTTDYDELSNLPKINNITLSGNKTTSDLGINIPTKTSDLTNDSGFLTSHQDISGKANTTYVDEEIARVESEIPTVPENVSAFTNDAGYLTEHQSLANYYTKNEVYNKNETYSKNETYNKSEVDNLITFVVHLQDGENDTLVADYTFAQIMQAIERMQWVILKYGNDTYTVYSRDNTHILWQSTRYYDSALTTRQFNLTSADVWSKETQNLSLNDIKPIIVHITKSGNDITADYTFTQLNNAVANQVIECCYNGNHVAMASHTAQKITFTSNDVDMDTGATHEVDIEVDSSNNWRMYEDTYVPLKEDKLLYSFRQGLLVEGTLNSNYVDADGYLTTTGSSGSWDDWNITGMDLSAFRFIRFLCIRDTSNTGGTWVCDVPMIIPIQASGSDPGFFVASGQTSSFGDRNRWNVCQCGVKGDKTAIALGQVFSLYGTAATTVSGIKIAGVYGVY